MGNACKWEVLKWLKQGLSWLRTLLSQLEVTQGTAERETFLIHWCSQPSVFSKLKVKALYNSKAEC